MPYYFLFHSPPFTYDNSLDLYNQVYISNTNLTFHVIVTDGGTPTRGTYANVTVCPTQLYIILYNVFVILFVCTDQLLIYISIFLGWGT